MMLRLAWRNLWRSKRRTLITALSVALGLFLATTFVGVATYMYSRLVDAGARLGLGHVTVQSKAYVEAESYKKTLRGVSRARQAALAIPGVTDALPRVQGPALFSTAARGVGGLMSGVDPALESPDTSRAFKGLVAGELLKPGDLKGVLLGQRLAEKLKTGLGRKVVVNLNNIHGELGGALFRVRGIFKTGSDELDGALAFIHIDAARGLLGYDPDEALALAVFIKDAEASRATAQRLAQDLAQADWAVRPWQEVMADIEGLIATDKVFDYFFQAMIGLMIALGILNTILVSVLERRREFGIMLALGLRPRQLFGLVLMESALIGALGLALALAALTPWVAFLLSHGIDLTSLVPQGVDFGGVMVELKYHFLLRPAQALAITLILLFFTLAAGLYPAWKAGRVPPMESIREL